MKILKTNCGVEFIIDAEDMDKLWAYSFYIMRTKTNCYINCSKRRRNGKQPQILLHRLLMNTPAGMDVDHKNRNTLDCRKNNLRNVARAVNMRNMPARNEIGEKFIHATNTGYQVLIRGPKPDKSGDRILFCRSFSTLNLAIETRDKFFLDGHGMPHQMAR